MGVDLKMGKRYKIITHNDLDGIGAAVVGKVIFNKQEVYSRFCGYDTVNKIVRESLNEDWDHIFITDISVDKDTAEMIEADFKDRVTLLDHHPVEWLNEYEWAKVKTSNPDKKDEESGTSLFYKYLKKSLKLEGDYLIQLEFFVEKVRRYDTWDWHNHYNDMYAKQLNDYMGIIGLVDFMNEMTDKLLKGGQHILDETAMTLLKYKQKEIDLCVKTKQRQIYKETVEGINVGFIFAESYHSELGNRLMENDSWLDVIIIFDLGREKISLRSTDAKVEIDCTDLARNWFCGGGHRNASGSSIPGYLMDSVRAMIFRPFTGGK